MIEEKPLTLPIVFQLSTHASKTLLKQRILIGSLGIVIGTVFHLYRNNFSSIDRPLFSIIESITVLQFLIGIVLIVGEVTMYNYKRRARIEVNGDAISQFAKGTKRVMSGSMNDVVGLRTMSGFIFQNRTVFMVDFGKLRLISFAHDIDHRELLISMIESHTGKKFNRRRHLFGSAD